MAADLLGMIRAEIEQRLTELRPLMAEYENLLSADEALANGSGVRKSVTRSASAVAGAGTTRRRPGRPRKAATGSRGFSGKRPPGGTGLPRGPRSAASKAVLAALEHGSHTVSELAVVSGLSDMEVRAGIRPLQKGGAIVKVSREGKAAYALPNGA